MIFRKANANDIDAIERIYNEIHLAEKNGEANIGWEMGECILFAKLLKTL